MRLIIAILVNMRGASYTPSNRDNHVCDRGAQAMKDPISHDGDIDSFIRGVRAAIVLTVTACTGCVPVPTPYGVAAVPVPMLVVGAIESAKKSVTESAARRSAQEKNRQELEADYKLYRSKADVGDPVSQLNMSRIFNRQAYLYSTDSDFAGYDPAPMQAEADKYLKLSVNQDYPPALTYAECRKQKEIGSAWQPDERDIAMLEKAAGMGEARAKYLLAKFVYQFGVGTQRRDQVKADRLFLEAYRSGDTAATAAIGGMSDPSIYPPEIAKESKAANVLRHKQLESQYAPTEGTPEFGRSVTLDPCSDRYRN